MTTLYKNLELQNSNADKNDKPLLQTTWVNGRRLLLELTLCSIYAIAMTQLKIVTATIWAHVSNLNFLIDSSISKERWQKDKKKSKELWYNYSATLIVVCFGIFSYTERFWSAVKLGRLSIRFKVSL